MKSPYFQNIGAQPNRKCLFKCLILAATLVSSSCWAVELCSDILISKDLLTPNLAKVLERNSISPNLEALDSQSVFARANRVISRQIPTSITRHNNNQLQYLVRDLRAAANAFELYLKQRQESLIPLSPVSSNLIAKLAIRFKGIADILERIPLGDLRQHGVKSFAFSRYQTLLDVLKRRTQVVFLTLHLPDPSLELDFPAGVDIVFNAQKSWIKMRQSDESIEDWIETVNRARSSHNRIRSDDQKVENIFLYNTAPLSNTIRNRLAQKRIIVVDI